MAAAGPDDEAGALDEEDDDEDDDEPDDEDDEDELDERFVPPEPLVLDDAVA